MDSTSAQNTQPEIATPVIPECLHPTDTDLEVLPDSVRSGPACWIVGLPLTIFIRGQVDVGGELHMMLQNIVAVTLA